jgi:hypothetical protein
MDDESSYEEPIDESFQSDVNEEEDSDSYSF